MPDISPKVIIQILIPDDLSEVLVQMGFRYFEKIFFHSSEESFFPLQDGWMRRNFQRETEDTLCMNPLFSSGKEISSGKYRYEVNEDIDLLFDSIERLCEEKSWEIEYQQEIRRVSHANAKVHVAITTGIDWFDTEISVELDQAQVDIGEKLVEAMRNNKRYILLDNGAALLIKEDIKKSIE